jgi:hypothetical protein
LTYKPQFEGSNPTAPGTECKMAKCCHRCQPIVLAQLKNNLPIIPSLRV